MPLDDRLRSAYARAASDFPLDVAPGSLDAVVSRTRAVRRRRRTSMSVAAVIVAAAGVLGTHGLLTRLAEPVPADTHPERTVVSSLHAYSVHLPDGWTVTRGRTGWALGSDPRADGVPDVYRSPTHQQILVASQPMPAGMTLAQWYTRYLPKPGQRPECYGDPSGWQPATVDGVSGGLFGRAFWCNFTEVVVAAGGRVYDIRAVPDYTTFTDQVFDQPLLNDFLSTMRLRPQG
jgi:hypothetical protein